MKRILISIAALSALTSNFVYATSLDGLPNEILTEIFSYLPDLGGVGNVNRNFYTVANTIYLERIAKKRMFQSAEDGDLATFKEIITQHPTWINLRNSYGNTALHLAVSMTCSQPYADLVEFILKEFPQAIQELAQPWRGGPSWSILQNARYVRYLQDGHDFHYVDPNQYHNPWDTRTIAMLVQYSSDEDLKENLAIQYEWQEDIQKMIQDELKRRMEK